MRFTDSGISLYGEEKSLSTSNSWTTRELFQRLVLPGELGNQAILELKERYGGIVINVGKSIGYSALGGDASDFRNWVWVWMYSTRRLNTLALKMLELPEKTEEKDHRGLAAGYLKKIVFSGKMEFITEFSLYDSLDDERTPEADSFFNEHYETDFMFSEDGNKTTDLFAEELNNLKPRDRIVIALAFFSATHRLQMNDIDWAYLTKATGLSYDELNRKIDIEVTNHSGKTKFPISGNFISELLKLSGDNVYKIKQRFKTRLKAVVEGK